MKRIDITIDCTNPEAAAAFWAAALDYDNAEVVSGWVFLSRTDSSLPKLLLQPVAEPKTVKNRIHLDIVTPDIEEEAARLERLGARRIEAGARSADGFHWIVMADLDGNEFCVADGP